MPPLVIAVCKEAVQVNFLEDGDRKNGNSSTYYPPTQVSLRGGWEVLADCLLVKVTSLKPSIFVALLNAFQGDLFDAFLGGQDSHQGGSH